jgi:3-oxoacyl-[acyl-carrier protein] reductase
VHELAESTAETQNRSPEEVLAEWEEGIPARRLGKPEELAALIAFLGSEQAAYITGTTIQMDGGLTQGLL